MMRVPRTRISLPDQSDEWPHTLTLAHMYEEANFCNYVLLAELCPPKSHTRAHLWPVREK